jgi:hypothetical protein
MVRLALVWLAVVASVAGCANGMEPSAGEGRSYPLVTEARPEYQPAVTTAGGSIVQLPVRPSDYEAVPSRTCERMMATFHDGSTPTKRPIVVPPRPGLRATAISVRDVELAWSFHDLPSHCRPTQLLVAVVASGDAGATPTNNMIDVEAESGTTRVTYPDFLPPPDVAMAAAYSREGHRSRVAKVLISR